MKIYIVIPAYNEAATIERTLKSLLDQGKPADKIVVVNDNSTDETANLVRKYTETNPNLKLAETFQAQIHQPGSKIIHAFNTGLQSLDDDYDVICKFDADIEFPSNYLERLAEMFERDPKIGMAGGIPYIKSNAAWVFENIASKKHLRGPIKAYRKACFEQIGGLKSSIGWDTADVLLAQFFDWKVKTDPSLQVKHLKPTGALYNRENRFLQGEANFKLRYGFVLSLLTSLKGAWKRRRLSFFINGIRGYFRAKRQKMSFLVDEEQGQFIRKYRWRGILRRSH